MSNKVVNYLTLACTGTGQATFYNSREDQEKALEQAHLEILQGDRRTYALSAVLPINDKSKQLILRNLLATGKLAEDSALEGHVVGMVVGDLQFNRVLNLYMELREKKVNCKRVRNLGRLIWDQVDAYRAIKYAPKVRTVLRHCHIAEGTDPVRAEIHKWLFGKVKKVEDVHYNPKLASRLRAKADYAALFDLPYDIARDIAVNVHKKKVEDFDREFAGQSKKEGEETAEQPKGKLTRKESLRARKTTGDTAVDFNRFGLYELLMHGHNNPHDIVPVLESIQKKARQIAGNIRLPDKVALVVDNSTSALGSAERRYQPLANMEAVIRIFREVEDSEVREFYVGPKLEAGLLAAEGASNIRVPLVKALLTRPQVVVILSDGYENVRAGSVSQILASKAVRESGIHVIHLNPVAAAETGKTRELAQGALTFALPSPEQLPMVSLIGIAAADPKMLEPMFAQVELHLKNGDYRAARLAVRNAAPALAVVPEVVEETVAV
jgi:hypothetical protein